MAKKEKDKNVWMGPKSSLMLIAPNELTLVKDEAHALYDSRVEMAPNESLVKNIMLHGIIEPVVIAKDGKNALVVDGRQRVIAALEANKRLKKQGGDPIRVPCVKRQCGETGLFGALISANEHRREDNPLEKAIKLSRFLNLGGTEEEAQINFGVSKQTVAYWIRILDLSTYVKNAIAAGKVSASAACKLAGLSAKEQKDALIELMKETPQKKVTSKRTEAKVRNEKPVEQRLRRKSEVLAMAEMVEGTVLESIFKWLLGEDITAEEWQSYGIEFEEDEEEETDEQEESEESEEEESEEEESEEEESEEEESEEEDLGY